MPLIHPLAAPGSPGRFLGLCSRLRSGRQLHPSAPPIPIASFPTKYYWNRPLSNLSHRRRHRRSIPGHRPLEANDTTRPDTPSVPRDPRATTSDSTQWPPISVDEVPEETANLIRLMLGLDDAEDVWIVGVREEVSQLKSKQKSRARRHAERASRPNSILMSIQNDAQDLYTINQSGQDNPASSHSTSNSIEGSPQLPRHVPSPILDSQLEKEPETLYSILSRRMLQVTATPSTAPIPDLSASEIALLHSQGYSFTDLHDWLSCLLEHRSVAAASMFRDSNRFPPIFLVLLFLRRRRMKMTALGIIMRHIAARQQSEPLAWSTLQILVVRLLRHARVIWPESIPWIASMYSTEATRIIGEARRVGPLSPKLHQAISHFSNNLLLLIALPTALHPLLNSGHQEKAQFQILHFMQSCDPAIVVTRTGFRAVARNQLMHPKTAQESDWAMLKGPSWPPWKEARTAMDDEKGYEYGVSRASRILHRMYEAGYTARTWEQLADIYAGWDTDLSPTVQTRSTLPGYATHGGSEFRLQELLWAGRIRATRTRREAWACFLACEASVSPAPAEAYFVMFEKLHYPEVDMYDRAEHEKTGSDKRPFLPGSMKEVQPDPRSPLHLVHISEPVPTYEQLFHRLSTAKVSISDRLLAFLVATHPSFDAVLKLLETNRARFNNGVHALIRGMILDQARESPVPGYFLGAFIAFLCRFGRFSHLPTAKPIIISRMGHEARIKTDKHYLLDYAYALLMHFQPHYRPAWTAYMKALIFVSPTPADRNLRRVSQADAQYAIMSKLFEALVANEVDPDDAQFRLLCTSTRFAVQAAYRGDLTSQDAQHILSTAPRLLRTVFHALVSANADMNATSQLETTIPPHIPQPALLHAYVRALGTLRDYEGLYSFATWAVNHHIEVSARANVQRSGSQALYRTFVALRAGLEGSLEGDVEGAPADLTALVKAQLESVDEWGWPRDEDVAAYVKKSFR